VVIDGSTTGGYRSVDHRAHHDGF